MENLTLFEQYNSGSMEALDSLIEENKGLAMYFFNRYRFLSDKYADLGPEDIEQACWVGLWQGIINWDPGKGQLSTSAAFRIKTEIFRLVTKRSKAEKEGLLTSEKSLDAELKDDDFLSLLETLEDPQAIDPQEAAYQNMRFAEFCEGLRDWAGVDDQDLRDLHQYVFEDHPPAPGLFEKIRKCILSPTDTKGRAFWSRWIDDRTLFLRARSYGPGRPIRTGHSDPTAEIVFSRERLEDRLTRMLENVE